MGLVFTRRRILWGAAFVAGSSLIRVARASPASEAAMEALTKGAQVNKGRVTLNMPAIAENGLSVFTTIAVESPMSETDHVKAIHLFSEKNPLPLIASFHFTPAMGQAKVSTNIRLAASQKVIAIALMSDGSLWSDEKSVVVTIAACIDGG